MNNQISPAIAVPVRPSKEIDERPIIKQLPSDLKEKLGGWVGSGFDLNDDTREVFFEHGFLSYQLGAEVVNVVLD